MGELIECQNCGRRIVSEAAKKIGKLVVCPNCVAPVKQALEAERLKKAAEAKEARLLREAEVEERAGRGASSTTAPAPVSDSIWKKCSYCGTSVGFLSGLGDYPDRARFLPKQLQQEGYHICPSCADKLEVTCPDCGKDFPLKADGNSFVVHGYQCPHCIEAKELEGARDISSKLLLPLLNSEPGTGNVRGRDYENTGVDPNWLCEEIRGFFGVKRCRAYVVKNNDGTCVVAGDIVVAVRGDSDRLVVRIAPLREYLSMLEKSAGVAGGVAGAAASITGLGLGTFGLLGAAVAAFAAAVDISRDITQDKLAAFVDERIQAYMAGPEKGGNEKSVAELLRDIAELKKSGVLTEEEFARKKEELLRRM
jgi:ssDNA-binding Zn-finger/Zn-ribbon topoisomerase 1